jgi:hypothetical protein
MVESFTEVSEEPAAFIFRKEKCVTQYSVLQKPTKYTRVIFSALLLKGADPSVN